MSIELFVNCFNALLSAILSDYKNTYYSNFQNEAFQSILRVEIRNLEIMDFNPGKNWRAIGDGSDKPLNEEELEGVHWRDFDEGFAGPKYRAGGTEFTDIDLTDLEWADYDEKLQAPVEISSFEYRIVPVRA